MPVVDGCADMIFMSMVWHHISDKGAAVAGFRRVLRHGGYLCIRTATVDALGTCLYLDFFPTARAINERMLSSRQALIDQVVGDRFSLVNHALIRQTIAPSLREYAERIALRGLSDLAAITDEEFDEGMAALRRYCANDPASETEEEVDLFVFQRATEASG